MNTVEIKKSLENKFDFSIQRKAIRQNYFMHTQFIQMGFDGRRKRTEDYWLNLKHIPKEFSVGKYDECICDKFHISFNNEEKRTIPCLSNWTYRFEPMSGLGQENVFGIPHEPFEKLQDNYGIAFTPEIKYAIYNNFVDYHALSNVLIMYGAGIEKIKKIGDKVKHAGAYSKAPISLKNIIQEDSVFCNGEITLELIGISSVDGKPCALLKYDSGESTLDMKIISKNGITKTIGVSQYIGDIYLDIESGWVRRVNLNEFVISERTEPQKPTKKNYTVRNLYIKLISN